MNKTLRLILDDYPFWLCRLPLSFIFTHFLLLLIFQSVFLFLKILFKMSSVIFFVLSLLDLQLKSFVLYFELVFVLFSLYHRLPSVFIVLNRDIIPFDLQILCIHSQLILLLKFLVLYSFEIFKILLER